MSILVKTSGDFDLQDSNSGEMAFYDRPTVVEASSFFQGRIASGDLKVVRGTLPKDYTDADFVKALAANGGNVDKTLAGIDAVLAPKPAKDSHKKD